MIRRLRCMSCRLNYLSLDMSPDESADQAQGISRGVCNRCFIGEMRQMCFGIK